MTQIPFITRTLLIILIGASFFYSCGTVEEPKQDDVFSVTENGQTVFYSESDKAFGDIYLGMPKYKVDSLLMKSNVVTMSGREYTVFCGYSTSGMLSSFYLRSDSVPAKNQNLIVDEIEDVISVKYGKLNMTYVSELPRLGISKKTIVNDHAVHWGSHWNSGSKYITLGSEASDSTRFVWVWIFNTNLWTQLGDDKANQEANNF